MCWGNKAERVTAESGPRRWSPRLVPVPETKPRLPLIGIWPVPGKVPVLLSRLALRPLPGNGGLGQAMCARLYS